MENIENDIIWLYKIVLNSKYRTGFPKGFWKKEGKLEDAITVLDWLFNDLLKYTEEDVINSVCTNFFRRYKLQRMIKDIFDGSIYNVINTLYPNKYKQWELRSVPNNYWNKEHCKEAVQWLIEEVLNLKERDIPRKVSNYCFRAYGLQTMLQKEFSGSVFKAIDNAYPNKYKQEEFRNYSYEKLFGKMCG